MATQCSKCPILRACSQRAEALEEAGGPGTVAGVWGGEYWRDGMALDPWGTDDDDMRSVYRYVWFDRDRGTWRAERVIDGKRHYITSSKLEHVAGQRAYEWTIANELEY